MNDYNNNNTTTTTNVNMAIYRRHAWSECKHFNNIHIEEWKMFIYVCMNEWMNACMIK